MFRAPTDNKGLKKAITDFGGGQETLYGEVSQRASASEAPKNILQRPAACSSQHLENKVD